MQINLSKEVKIDKERAETATAKMRNIRVSELGKSGGQQTASNAFYGFMALNLNLKVDDNKQASMAVAPSGNKDNSFDLYYNPEFVLGMSPETKKKHLDYWDALIALGVMTPDEKKDSEKQLDLFFNKKSTDELVFLYLHELDHIIKEAWCRQEALIGKPNKDNQHKFQLFNKAQDYVINNSIAIDKYGSIKEAKEKLPFLQGACLDEKYVSWTTEQIYLDLLEEHNSGKQNNKYVIDSHMLDDLTEEQKEAIGDMIVRSAKSAGKEGTPKGIWKIIEDLDRPKIDYRKLLDKRLKSMIVTDYSYTNPHIKSHHMTKTLRNKSMIGYKQYVVYPRVVTDGKVQVIAGVDTSGSVTVEEQRKMLGELVGMLGMFHDYELVVVCWGSDVVMDSLKTFTPQNVNELKAYEFLAGGGTNIQPTVEFMTQYKDHQKVILTDGYLADKIPTNVKGWHNSIWVLTQRGSGLVAPFGTTCYLEDAK